MRPPTKAELRPEAGGADLSLAAVGNPASLDYAE